MSVAGDYLGGGPKSMLLISYYFKQHKIVVAFSGHYNLQAGWQTGTVEYELQKAKNL